MSVSDCLLLNYQIVYMFVESVLLNNLEEFLTQNQLYQLSSNFVSTNSIRMQSPYACNTIYIIVGTGKERGKGEGESTLYIHV